LADIHSDSARSAIMTNSTITNSSPTSSSAASVLPPSRATTPPASDDVIREVFLSPRVIDREAYADYASGLRRLIEESSTSADALRAAAMEAQQAQNALRETAAKHQPKIDQAARTLATVESRLAEAEKLTNLARDTEATIGAVRQQLDTLAAAKLAEINLRAERIVREAEDRAASIRQTAQAESQRLIEQAVTKARQLAEDAITMAERRAAHIERSALERADQQIAQRLDQQLLGRTRELESRLDALSQRELPVFDFDRAEDAAHAVEAAVAKSQHLLHDAAARAQRLSDDASNRVIQLQSLTDQAGLVRELLGKTINEATVRVDDLLDKAEGVKQTAAAIAPACSRAEERIAASLRQMEVSAETARAVVGDAGTLVSRLGVLVEQLKPWGPMLITREGEDLPPVIQDAVERARARIMTEAAEISGALSDVSARMARYSTQLGR
jgi:vacuolar-type H+-ATPase subunit H